MVLQNDQNIVERPEMKEPPSPKKQKTEGRPDEQQEVRAAVETPSSSSSSSSSAAAKNLLNAGDPSVPPSSPRRKVWGFDPNGRWYNVLMAYMNSEVSSSDEDENEDLKPQDEERMKRDTLGIAHLALDFYNEKEGVKYVFDEPFLCGCYLFNLAMIFHANFTAKEENSCSPSQLFFAEALKFYGGGFEIVKCVKLDTFGTDGVRKGCIYCRKVIDHPPVESCEFGKNEIDDEKKVEEYRNAITSPSPSDD